jgi:hypothetical protein
MAVSQFLQARAWWRLDRAGASALHVGRSVVSLLDAAVYLRDVPDDDPDIVALEAAGCFRGDAFDPGQEGAAIVREWQLADEPTGGPRDLLTALAQAAATLPPATLPPATLPPATPPPATPPPATAAATPGPAVTPAEISIPRQPGAPAHSR